MRILLAKLCQSIAEDYTVLGDRDRYVSVASTIGESEKESITFYAKNAKDALTIIKDSRAGIVICSKELCYKKDGYKDKTLILVSNPKLAFIQIMRKYFQKGPAKIMMGKNVIIHRGTVIGEEGFSYGKNSRSEWERFPHIGNVILGDNVEIGANSVIDRGTLSDTVIGNGTKIGNLCLVGHNVVVGKNCIIGAQTFLGGGSRIGDSCWIAPGAIIRNGIKIGNNVLVGMGSVVTKGIGDNCVAYGVPARVVRKH